MADEINQNAGVDAMRAKFDEIDAAPEEPVEVEAPPAEAAPAEEPGETRPRRADGTFMSKEEAEKAAPPKKGPEVKAKPSVAPGSVPGKEAAPVVPAEAAPPAPKFKPPQSWKPTIREKWTTLPPEVQEEIDRREREIARGLQESSGPRQNWDRFTQAVAPYQSIIAASGADPVTYTQSLLQTAAALQMGTPGQRAAVVANVIRQFGVDVTQLAEALDKPGAAPAGPQAAPDVQTLVDQRLQAMVQQANQQRAVAEVAKFEESHEFASDPQIRATMAALIQGNIAKDLDTAYDMAVSASSEHRSVIEQRKAAEAAKAAQASMQQKQKAGVSVRSTPAVPAGDRTPVKGQEGLDAMRRRAAELGME